MRKLNKPSPPSSASLRPKEVEEYFRGGPCVEPVRGPDFDAVIHRGQSDGVDEEGHVGMDEPELGFGVGWGGGGGGGGGGD